MTRWSRRVTTTASCCGSSRPCVLPGARSQRRGQGSDTCLRWALAGLIVLAKVGRVHYIRDRILQRSDRGRAWQAR